MKYQLMDIWNINEFNFLNEEVEKFTSISSKNLVNLGSPSYLKEKTVEYYIFSFSFEHGDMLLV